MAWTVEEIEKTFLNGKINNFGLAPELVTATFERTEQLLGRDWIMSQLNGTGLWTTLPIIEMGLRLTSLDGIPDAAKLLDALRKGEQNTEAELTAIHLLRSTRPTAQVELYPPVEGRVADFRIREGDEQWTTVEVTQPEDSDEKQRLQAVLRRFTDALEKLDNQFVLEILLLREPTEEEITVLCDRLPEFCEIQGPQQARLNNELGFLFLNLIPIGQLVKHDIPGHETTPMIGLATFTSGGPRGGPHHQVSVRIPYTDNRAEEILRSEAKQLPKNGQGLIMVDVTRANGSFETWASVFQRRFQPKQHTRISGVCLFEGSMGPAKAGYDWLIKTQLLVNPHAQCKLPEWIHAAIAQAGAKYAESGLP